jgi:hypothetical protein
VSAVNAGIGLLCSELSQLEVPSPILKYAAGQRLDRFWICARTDLYATLILFTSLVSPPHVVLIHDVCATKVHKHSIFSFGKSTYSKNSSITSLCIESSVGLMDVAWVVAALLFHHLLR